MLASGSARRWSILLAAAFVVAVAWMVWQRFDGTVTPTPRTGGTAAATAAPGTGLTSAGLEPHAVHVDPGQEIYAIDLGMVVEVDFETSARTIVVRRSPESSTSLAGDAFTISVKTGGSAETQACQGGPALQAVLEQLSSIKVVRVIGADEAAALQRSFGAGAATLRIRDRSTLDPAEFRVLFSDTPPPGALVLDGPALYEISVPHELFERFSAGCDALGGEARSGS